jgi:hypothetical protein
MRMSEKNSEIPWLDAAAIDAWRNFPREELAKYAGQFIAYSWDATHIVASGETEMALHEKFCAAGIDPSRVIVGYIDPVDACPR